MKMEKFKQKLIPSKPKNKDNSCMSFWKNKYFRELNPKEKFSYKIVNQILYSKRLLIDHVEALELTIPHIDRPAKIPEYFTFRNTSILVFSSILHKIIIPRQLRFTLIPVSILTSGFLGIYFVKKVSDIKQKYVESIIDKLIQSLEEFGNCIKRNMMYFNEILVMKPKELIESRQIERAWDCITSIKEVIEILYDATRKLEEDYLLSSKYHEFYFPMEELKESTYFNKNVTDFTPKNIKDFYNIYSYVQSQFLLRLALTVGQYQRISFILKEIPEIQREMHQHVNEEDEHFINLTTQLRSKQHKDIHEQSTFVSKSGPVAVLKESSMKLSSCIIAVAEECQKLDSSLQMIDEIKFADKLEHFENKETCLSDISKSMKVIENSLELCYDDFQRLMVVYNKFLNVDIESSDTDSNHSKSLDGLKSIEANLSANQTTDDGEIEKKDDFFAYVEDGKEISHTDEPNEKNDYDFELINLDEKLTKGKFKPVLKQLKTKINPIKKEMLEKEKQVLESKGIDISKLIDHEKADKTVDLQNETQNNVDQNLESKNTVDQNLDLPVDNNNLVSEESYSDSEGSADELEKLMFRQKKDNYEERRNFLAQKEAVNIFANAKIIPSKQFDEDILE